MERTEIIKALECCTSPKDCNCPLTCPWADNGCEQNLMYHALTLIKELTEENERLRAENEKLEIYNKDYKYRNKELQKAHKELLNQRAKRYYHEKVKNDPVAKAKRAEYHAKWQRENKEKFNAYHSEYRKRKKERKK